jgi:hypothetical protein
MRPKYEHFENLHFFEPMHSNFEKIPILSKKNFLKFHDGVSKNAEFNMDSSFFLMGSKNVQKKSYKQNTFAKSAKS